MHFELNEEQILIQESAKKFALKKLCPIAAGLERPENREIYLEQLQGLSSLGFMGLNVDSAYGGAEAGVIAFSVALTEISKACASTGVAMSVNNLVAEVIQIIGSREQKETYIPRICSGEYTCGAFCLSESEAGSDPSRLKTRAEETDEGWKLNGSKMWISNAEYAGLFVVWAVTDPDAKPGKGISCFIVESDNPGVSIGAGELKMGQIASSTNAVHFTDCLVPKSALLGKLNEGFKIAVGELTGGRIGIASLALGIGSAALEEASRYITDRRQFGQTISEFQGPQFMIADAYTEMEASRLLTLQAAWLKENQKAYMKQASMAKLYASEWANRACYTSLQLMGGAGYTKDYPLEKYARDARVTTIYEGTSEIQRVIISREILKDIE